ncbi:U32 family peptidase [Aromatoleum bremense]|uniref:U32 family peptidase n=1 Tax=Aromatoleum bremense TaxID=76115 RepID=A0ABX1NRT9_9RHOO|nr:U32 family peptidase [Aromatoleum bremense]NMG14691.1 U32 family peptidase [Aromatoleum bremense]QTQ30461.1 Peptidase, U32 family [Aromatoleum bremense]
MKITAPISTPAEVEPLVRAGARELYCGVVPPEWIRRFNTSGVNRRVFGNLNGYADLERVIDNAHTLDAEVFLVLNAQQYGEQHLDALTEIAAHFRSIGGNAAIVADISLIASLAANVPELAIHVSSVATCRNVESARFFAQLGARRIILPRDVTVAEIAAIATELPELDIEAFVLNDGCVFEEGACHTVHLPMNKGGPICIDNYQFEYRTASGEAPAERALRRLEKNDQDYKRWLWYRFGNGFSVAPNRYPWGPCGLCAMPAMHAAGVHSVKIAGREGASERKVKSVELVHEVLRRIEDGEPETKVRECAVGLRAAPSHCASGYMCYYPEKRSRPEIAVHAQPA